VFRSQIESLKDRWSSHMSYLVSITSEPNKWPEALDNTRRYLGELKRLVYLTTNGKELKEWVVFFGQVVNGIHNLEVVTSMWRMSKKDPNDAPYDYSGELARDIIHIWHLLSSVGMLENKFSIHLSWLLDNSRGEFEPTLKCMLEVELKMAKGDNLDRTLFDLSAACESIGRNDRVVVVASRAFWYSLSKANFVDATTCFRIAIKHGGSLKDVFAILGKNMINWSHSRRLGKLVVESEVGGKEMRIGLNNLLNMLVTQYLAE
jgi:hypothetical protein